MLRRVPVVAVFILLGLSLASAQRANETVDVTRWQVAWPETRFEPIYHGVRMTGGHGWAHTATPVSDFGARLEFRAVTPDAEGAVVVRGGSTKPGRFGPTPAWWPDHGYAVSLGEVASPNAKVGEVRGYRGKVRIVSGREGPLPSSSPGAWHLLLITCEEDTVTVSIDGVTVTKVQGEEIMAGCFGLEHVRGDLEVRDISLVPQPVGGPCRAGESEKFPSGVVKPILIKQERAEYPHDALAAKRQGKVRVGLVIGTDGVPAAPCVERSLDPELDAYAVAAVRRWRFTPATRDDKPVPVPVSVELDFILR